MTGWWSYNTPVDEVEEDVVEAAEAEDEAEAAESVDSDLGGDARERLSLVHGMRPLRRDQQTEVGGRGWGPQLPLVVGASGGKGVARDGVARSMARYHVGVVENQDDNNRRRIRRWGRQRREQRAAQQGRRARRAARDAAGYEYAGDESSVGSGASSTIPSIASHRSNISNTSTATLTRAGGSIRSGGPNDARRFNPFRPKPKRKRMPWESIYADLEDSD